MIPRGAGGAAHPPKPGSAAATESAENSAAVGRGTGGGAPTTTTPHPTPPYPTSTPPPPPPPPAPPPDSSSSVPRRLRGRPPVPSLGPIRSRLDERAPRCPESDCVLDSATLRLRSMREDYSPALLRRFYDGLMIPNFPLEDERDDLEDWILDLDPTLRDDDSNGGSLCPVMDVLILICDRRRDGGGGDGGGCGSVEEEKDDESADGDADSDAAVLAGAAVEYYRRSSVGLVSYVVVSPKFRRLGIMRAVHAAAIRRIRYLCVEHGGGGGGCDPRTPRAIFAETNAASRAVCEGVGEDSILARHAALFRLGYRMVVFPYRQPPLDAGGEPFDRIILLVYRGEDDDGDGDALPVDVPYEFVLDFYGSVFGYCEVGAGRYGDCSYYRLADWYRSRNGTCAIKPDLPFWDVAEAAEAEMTRDEESASAGTGAAAAAAAESAEMGGASGGGDDDGYVAPSAAPPRSRSRGPPKMCLSKRESALSEFG